MDISKLPFVVQPKSEKRSEKVEFDGGYFEVPVRGFLTTGEKSYAQQALSGDDGTIKMIALSRKIGAERKTTLDEAYKLVLRVLAGDPEDAQSSDLKELQLKYNEELTEILSSLALMQDKEFLVAATIILKYRVNSEITFEDVMTYPPVVIERLYQIFKAEEAGDLSILDEESSKEPKPEATVNEIEKKPSRRRKVDTQTT